MPQSPTHSPVQTKKEIRAVFPLEYLFGNDAQLKANQTLAPLRQKYSVLASDESIARTVKALQSKTWQVSVVNTKEEALEMLKRLPNLNRSSYGQGGSTTLEELGWTRYLQDHPEATGRNIKAETIAARGNPEKSVQLMMEQAQADYFLSSANALTEDGHIITADNGGNRVRGILLAKKLVLVVGTNKIVANSAEGHKRLESYVVPIEGAHMRAVFGLPDTSLNQIVELRNVNRFLGQEGRVHVIIVKQHLGY